ncbi:DUF6221 family protein [Amycolatopsis thermoflava]|uniref:DUF6221 family protein n=1 Tax=Amycolatopsis thermoflava TaxID=84480 RepID=UPI00048925B7|nr:DUF6221 family protein [Amycolatopsis thermoflava]
MSDIRDRLIAAIDETEHIANAAAEKAREDYGDSRTGLHWIGIGGTLEAVDDPAGRASAEFDKVGYHVAHHDPASVLRRCAADRKLLELHEPQGSRKYCGECGGTDYPVSWPCPTLQYLAEGYGISAAPSE